MPDQKRTTKAQFTPVNVAGQSIREPDEAFRFLDREVVEKAEGKPIEQVIMGWNETKREDILKLFLTLYQTGHLAENTMALSED